MKRVLIVDDSLTAREYLKFIIDSAPGLEVAGEASTGETAVDLVKKYRPDIISMDIQMPGMNGYQTCRKIMTTMPTPIVMVSATADPEEITTSFKALEAGALSMVEKPKGPGHPDAEMMIDTLTRTLRLMADIKVIRRKKTYGEKTETACNPIQHRQKTGNQPVKLVVIGASTGGPPVIRDCLSGLPASFPVPILVVQHITKGFLPGMVSWLNQDLAVTCKIAEHNETAISGRVYFAPDGCHMEIQSNMKIILCPDDKTLGICPSASRLFASSVKSFGSNLVGILLTGMGKDGAKELLDICRAGGLTIAQSKETCVVFGMPGEAVKLGAAAHILAPDEICWKLSSFKG